MAPRLHLKTDPRLLRAQDSLFAILLGVSCSRFWDSPGVWQQTGRDMLFCLNPPHSLPFPHWPDGATLPAAAAADVSLAALAPPAPTSLPQAHCSSARTLQSRRGGCKLTGTHGARRAEGLGGGDARKPVAANRLG